MSHPSDNEPPVYRAIEIEWLSLPEAVRKYPIRYIGSTDQRALHFLLVCLVEGCIFHYQELQTPLDQVTVRLEQDGSATIMCKGSALSSVFLQQSAQVLLREWQETFRQTPRPMIANALCTRLSILARGVDNQWRSIFFEQGTPQADEVHHLPPQEDCDILLRIFPDFSILDPGSFDSQLTSEQMRPLRESHPSVTITVVDARSRLT